MQKVIIINNAFTKNIGILFIDFLNAHINNNIECNSLSI